MIRILSWNINQQPGIWHDVLDARIDVALLQEAPRPSEEVSRKICLERDDNWSTDRGNRNWRTTVAGLSKRIELVGRKLKPLTKAESREFGVSVPGSLAVADVKIVDTEEVITLVSMYGLWEKPVGETESTWIYADASVHRLISDISTLIGMQEGHRIIAAGDLNVLHGYGEHGSDYWGKRYQTIFSRMESLGLGFVGPQAPEGGQRAEPRPKELPDSSSDVPTYRTRQKDPKSAMRQLDFVFASQTLHSRLRVRALNSEAEWGPSDHCRILIELE